MGLTHQQLLRQPTTGTIKTTSTPSKPSRPGLVTSNGHNISYRSKSGRTLTFEFVTPLTSAPSTGASHKNEVNPFSNLAPLTSSDNNKSSSADVHSPSHLPSKSSATTQASAINAKASAQSPHPEKAQLVIRASKPKPSTKDTTSTKESAAPTAQENPGVLLGIYDTLSFWCMEAVEVAVWGAYDEPVPTPGPGPVAALQAAAVSAAASQKVQTPGVEASAPTVAAT